MIPTLQSIKNLKWISFLSSQIFVRTGLTNDDEVSKEFHPFKQMIELLNRIYKASYRPTNGFDNIDGANYELALWAACYNFLRPHKHAGYKVLNTDYPVQQKRGNWALFLPSGEDGFGQSLIMGQGTSPLQVHKAEPYALGELSTINICSFQGSFEPIF